MADSSRRILLVDDDEEDYMIIRDMFSDFPQHPFSVDWTPSFDEGKAMIHTHEHAAYLVDYRLGEKTGLDLISESSAQAPFILLTGQGDHEIDVEAMNRGAHDFLVKSQLSPPLLERSLRYAINRFQIMKELRESQAQVLQQDRMASIGLLASSLAHEIGTPLGVMRGRSEMTLMHAHDPALVQKNTEIILSQIDRISKLIRSLLTLARGDETKTVKPVDVSQVLSDVIDLLSGEFSKAKILFDNKIHPRTFVIAESGPLHQVFLNLLVNSVHAIQATARSGGSDSQKIVVSAQSDASMWTISISDTGCGISEENMKMLFKPFFTTKDIGHGTGLGLATSYRLIEAWGGRITCQSQAGVGTTFKLQLKRATEDTGAQ